MASARSDLQTNRVTHNYCSSSSTLLLVLGNGKMPRKSTKETKSAAPRSSSKRPAQETPQRQSKRAKATARKSYVDPGTDTDDADEQSTRKVSPSVDEQDGAASDYEDHDDKESSVGSEADETGSDEDDESKNRKPRGRAAKSLPIHKKDSDEQELWKPGAKLELGTRIVIKKPKARDAGDTPYLDHTIHPNTLLFLKELAANNDRSWLKREYSFSYFLVQSILGIMCKGQLTNM